MKSVQLAWVFGAVSALGLGMAAEACSSSSSTTTPPSGDGGHSSTGSTTGSGTSQTSSTGTGGGSTSSTSGTSSSSVTCYKAPGELFAEDGGVGVYCPFSATTDGGKAVHCTAGEHCCEPPESASMVSTCEPAATTCPVMNSTDWACEGTPDCAGTAGTVCCGAGTIKTQAPQPGCGDGGSTLPSYPYVGDFTGTSCVASCSLTTTTFQVCSKDSECPGGAAGSCVSIKPKGNGIGYCAGSGSGTGSSSSSSSSSSGSSSTSSGSSSASSSSGSASH